MNLLRRLLPGIALVAGTFLLSVGLQALAAWSAPSGSPPSSNAYAPLNTGPTAQTKSGGLNVTGNVGIGTASPSAQLSIVGSGQAAMSGTGNAYGLYLYHDVSAGTSYVDSVTGGTSVTKLQLRTYNNGTYNNGIFIDGNGNVGIDTVSPIEKLHVNGSLYVGSNWYKAGNISSVNNASAVWGVEGGVATGFSSGRAVVMGQNTNGYAGLGITSGVTRLGSFVYDHIGNNIVVQSYGNTNILLNTDFGSSNILFRTNQLDRMIVNSFGNVGIGTVSPSEKLGVSGNLYVSGLGKFGDLNAVNNGIGFWGSPQGVLVGASNGMMVGIGLAGNGSTGIGVSSGSTPYGAVGWDSVSGNFYVSAYGRNLILSSDANRSVSVSGNFGIGTAYPSQKLEVAGNIKIGRFYVGDTQYGTQVPGVGTDGWNVGVTTNGVFVVTNGGSYYQPVYASDYWINNAGRWASSFSDVRLKKNIQPLTNVLGRLQNIQSVSFNWNDAYAALGHPNDARQIGVIAQELETQFPELVTATSTDGYKSVNYEGLTAVLVEAVKEQQKEIDSLKARLDALEKK